VTPNGLVGRFGWSPQAEQKKKVSVSTMLRSESAVRLATSWPPHRPREAGTDRGEDVHDTEEAQEHNHKKMYHRKDSVTVLGLVCEKMAERVEVSRQQEETRRIREETVTVDSVDDDDSTAQEDHEDDEGAVTEREIWQVTDVTEEDFETTEGEAVDVYRTNSWT
jgi:hypothetical protein